MPNIADDKPLLRALRGQPCRRPPFWLMRQAGRYLPEYRATRAAAGSFLELCLMPELAAEVTLQPLRRFGMDGAILFSDILMVPYGLGQGLSFEEGRGPLLEAVQGPGDLGRLSIERMAPALAPVYETIGLLKDRLPTGTALIGFAGAPWTVASYMVEGGSSRDFTLVKGWAYRDPESFAQLIDLLVEATSAHLIGQIEAGVEAVQIFDSWVGILPDAELRRWGLEPVGRIVGRLRAAYPEVPIIVFPRGVGVLYRDYAIELGVNGLSLDTTVPIDWAARELQPHVALQGNLDPVLLVAGGEALQRGARRILDRLGRGPFIFNLGHGVLPQTPPEHVELLTATIRDWKS